MCEICYRKTRKGKDNYFIYIPLEQQIKCMLKKHLPQILDYLNQDECQKAIHDFFDGNIYKREKMKSSSILLPFTINLDGAQIFSSSASLWPIQLLQNYLPPNIRFKPENIIIVGLYCSRKKPYMPTILLPLALEINALQTKGIHIFFFFNRLIQGHKRTMLDIM